MHQKGWVEKNKNKRETHFIGRDEVHKLVLALAIG